MWRGTWIEAEQELTAATGELAASRPAMTVDGVVRLAELRRRQGRLVEASTMFEQAGHHPLAALGRAELAFDRGDVQAAAESAERYLRRVPQHNRTDHVVALDLLVRAQAEAGNTDAAKTALAELNAIAAVVGTVPLHAAASLGAGYVARHPRWRLGASSSRRRRRSVSAERRAVRARARSDRAGACPGDARPDRRRTDGSAARHRTAH